MARLFCIPGILLLTICLILSFLVSLSLPYLRDLDIVHVNLGGVSSSGTAAVISNVRFGIWSYCTTQANNGDVTCIPNQLGYSASFTSARGGGLTITADWTRGLLLHPIATFFVLFAWLLSFSQHFTVTLIASLMSFTAAGFMLIALAIDIALYVHVRNEFASVPGVADDTSAGAGLWITLSVLILLLISGCIVCFGRRRESKKRDLESPLSTKRPWYNKFRR